MKFKAKLYILFYIFILNIGETNAKDNKLNNKIEITSEALIVDQQQKLATFTGKAIAIHENMVISSNKMLAYYDNDNDRIYKIEFIGNVNLKKEDQLAKSEFGTYDVKNNKIELTGEVILIKSDHMLKGSHLIYDLNLGQAKMLNDKDKVRAIFSPSK